MKKIAFVLLFFMPIFGLLGQENPPRGFVELATLFPDFLFDMKYATPDNFLKQKVYDCPRCFLRTDAARALVAVAKELKNLGYRIKIFDCYRPVSVQEKMWKILPGTHYVANPKKGSKHNRGAAVDLTLVDENGTELDMGTPFDFFGKEAHHDAQNISKEAIKNRKLLKQIMDKHNFRAIFSEWWHYEYRPLRQAPLAHFEWNCP